MASNEKIYEEIRRLKKKHNAVILAHNYQVPEVIDIADFTGDSLALSRKAAATDADIIVFCGVHFMAETASVLAPEKTVLIPDEAAGCPMADMIDDEKILKIKAEHPGALVISYVNTTAAVKALSDICCTSANAVQVVKSLGDAEIIFVPDRNLGRYARELAGRKMFLYDGFCTVHMKILAEDIKKAKAAHPNAKVVVHPECTAEVAAMADEVASTSGMSAYAKNSDAREFIIGTETGMLYCLRRDNPDKKFYPASDRAVCANMKKITLEKVLWCLQELKYEVKPDAETGKRAFAAIEKMIEIS